MTHAPAVRCRRHCALLRGAAKAFFSSAWIFIKPHAKKTTRRWTAAPRCFFQVEGLKIGAALAPSFLGPRYSRVCCVVAASLPVMTSFCGSHLIVLLVISVLCAR